LPIADCRLPIADCPSVENGAALLFIRFAARPLFIERRSWWRRPRRPRRPPSVNLGRREVNCPAILTGRHDSLRGMIYSTAERLARVWGSIGRRRREARRRRRRRHRSMSRERLLPLLPSRVPACGCVWLRVAAGGCVWLRVRARHTRPPRSSYRRYHSHPHRPNGAARSFTDLIERGDKRPLSPINGRVMAPVRLTRVNGQTNSSLMLVVRGGDARGARDTPDTSRVARVPAPHHHRRRQRPRLHEGPDNSGDKLET
jgi:hypothetical protein